ncbi:MAG: hypothetical protein ABI472_02540 [Ginsengibacter sp.]
MKTCSFLNYLFMVAITTIILGVVYTAVQQSYRTSANDPQIQIARDIDAKLREGLPVDIFFSDTIDIEQSLSVFAVLYDAAGNPVRSSGLLSGKMPQLPGVVFDYAKSHGDNELTWQPKPGVRMATVIVSSKSSPARFVAVSRSLQVVETREHNLITIIFIGWTICIGLVLLYAVIQFYQNNKNKV